MTYQESGSQSVARLAKSTSLNHQASATIRLKQFKLDPTRLQAVPQQNYASIAMPLSPKYGCAEL